ncbi:MAG TPA: RNA polymerase sigma factor, partial [Verrucomicrobiae bacterium]|nr:RNA polymerase sigma factor [Verrucomicrobiae bacterium]
DLTQQTFYVWARKGHQLRDPARVKSWLLTTLHRDFLQSREHAARFPHYEVDSVANDLPRITPKLGDHLDGNTVMAALQQVEQLYRAPLTLFYLDNFSYLEIAQLLDIPAGTVMSRLSRGKEQLRKLLDVTPRRESTVIPLPAGPEHHG